MGGLGKVSADDVETVASLLDLDLSPSEAQEAADRCDALASVYQGIDGVPTTATGQEEATDETFQSPPRRSSASTHELNAWITRFDLIRPERSGPLDGKTVGIKDNTCVRGVELTVGSRAFEGVIAGTHATVVDRLLDAGGRLVGKTNMDELAFGPTSETSAFGPTRNPADRDHVAGGSSSGSAAAVAAGDADLAIGTDTGGSVRIPASYCGIVGVKGTYGLVPADGVVELARSLDHVGVLARDVETAATGLEAMADDPRAGADTGYTEDLGRDLSSVTVGVADRFFETHVSDTVETRVRDAIEDLAAMGATVEPVEIPELDYSREGWWGIAPLEFAAWYFSDGIGLWRRAPPNENLSRATARVRRASSGDFGDNVKQMLVLGGLLLTEYGGDHYRRCRHYQRVLRNSVSSVFESVDVLATPATPTTALELDGFERGVTPPVNWDTHPLNLTGHPAVSVPVDDDDGDLPVGLQFVADHWQEASLLDVAYAYEQADK
jgi:amidase/aspartyl-tRNA(Asn)/glutamyl-tRNA(Gln) amidotransferase subunit A